MHRSQMGSIYKVPGAVAADNRAIAAEDRGAESDAVETANSTDEVGTGATEKAGIAAVSSEK